MGLMVGLTDDQWGDVTVNDKNQPRPVRIPPAVDTLLGPNLSMNCPTSGKVKERTNMNDINIIITQHSYDEVISSRAVFRY